MKDNQLKQIYKRRKQFDKASYEGKRAIIQEEIKQGQPLIDELNDSIINSLFQEDEYYNYKEL